MNMFELVCKKHGTVGLVGKKVPCGRCDNDEKHGAGAEDPVTHNHELKAVVARRDVEIQILTLEQEDLQYKHEEQLESLRQDLDRKQEVETRLRIKNRELQERFDAADQGPNVGTPVITAVLVEENQ